MQYYVYNKLMGKPTVIHNCYESAEQEAIRLATKTLQNQEILQIVATVKPKVICEVVEND